ncbi:phosphate/phosphite/phosphonate ABC transporter substrate-binding protein [Frankia sp. CNm7]|uniref:Phosphate/phosphite/phosphonate ABC transporter substrate-binding protein n=1 Tax=Frankia nepalensis TaxID=1836974 RepID=A0A937UW43_9ACTN|nr:phosphate/phosphite/phosphonate ABC transporter substrate-binding protein [Frankia nepalensis]MBL7495016.1 phosphate/phosphite/phosphonate ABC transporter substrate-binding protein [Frankia nepalensis]MBL7513672.1 phosphate/phosphite/phosphonate ABC transporter substrate-binding protein [Frankia nepalensis]MBL7524597.1 phosphate/phosphite/phosphonate ABC transporter substrate-binding protein [Frankia nepalensis]MBL7633001.1 phosphate/phosphite/phosphonate ABC transporter substrate-binding pr
MTFSLRYRALAALAVGATLLISACGSDDSEDTAAASGSPAAAAGFPDKLVVAAVPAENSSDLKASYDPILKLLEKETGAEIEFSQATDYAGVIEGMIAGNVDLALFGAFSYVIAGNNDAKMTPVGAVLSEKGATPGYYSYGFTKADNAAVTKIDDFKGKKTCFVDPGSTSGFLYPSAGLIEAKVIASGSEADLAAGLTPTFAGAHDASVLGVKNGDCEVGFAEDSMVDTTLIEKGDLKEGELKVVWKSGLIPAPVFAANNDLGADVISKLSSIVVEKANSDYLLSQNLCTGDCLLTDQDAWGFAAAKDADYDPIREVCEATKSDKCKG